MSEAILAAGSDPVQVLQAINAAITVQDIDRAVALARGGIDAGWEHPLLLNLYAFDLERQARFDEALQRLGRASQLAPEDPTVFNSIGRCLSKQSRMQEALRAFDTALAIDPCFAPAHHGRGLALESLGDAEGAQAAQERAAALDPSYAEPLGALAELARQRADNDAARDFAERALKLDRNQPAAVLALAMLDFGQNDFASAERRMKALIEAGGLTPLHEASAQRLLADCLDAQGRPDQAFSAYAAANAKLRQVYSPQYGAPGVEGGEALCRRLARWFETAPAEAWGRAPGYDPEAARLKGHVFLVGFPRSGTTLLEQVLASHPEIASLEEQATLVNFGELFQDDAGLRRLEAMDEAEAARRRADYWRRVKSFGVEPEGKVFVDKMPLNTIWLPLIAKLFPHAKILFARRDPRDVVASCFRQRFRMNALMYPFTALEDAARFYDSVMGLAEVYQAKLPLIWYTHRHEELVENFDREAQAICRFIGVPWDEAMRDFAETAKRREVRTPSAPQVARGLYREGMGKWRRYEAGLGPVLPILAPWVKRFGYEAA